VTQAPPSAAPPAKPSLELLRSLTDEHVLRALMQARRLTRADLATRTGLSKPTVGESVRRLTAAGLLRDTGERTPGGRGRGRVGSYFALAGTIGSALVASIAPDGAVAESVDAFGDTVASAREAISRPARPAPVTAALLGAAAQVQRQAGQTTRLAVVSAADPVERGSGRLVHLSDSPFLLGELNPAEILAPQVAGPVIVDNDVNWAARAEREHGSTGSLDDFAYVFLGEGLGCAIVSHGEVSRGCAGLAGEIAHLVTVGPHGQATRLIEVFGELGLRRAGSTAIDADRLLSVATGQDSQAVGTRHALGQAISGVLAAIVALADPGLVIIGGSWGRHPVIMETISSAFARLPRHVPVRAAELTDQPSLAGARSDAVRRLRSAIVAAAHPSHPA
jgi:predicted NBD/HSP70 family sugar kinase